jgi:Arc/MetJ-type ribon-helix-helix transcriptional regulator
MGKSKLAITLSEPSVRHLDDLVRRGVYRNRSQAIQQAVDDKIAEMGRSRLAAECAKLDPVSEGELADEGLGDELPTWPES